MPREEPSSVTPDRNEKEPGVSSGPFSVLLIEPSDAEAQRLLEVFDSQPHLFRVRRESSLALATLALKAGTFQAILCALALPDAAGLEGMFTLQAVAPDCPIIVLTDRDETEKAVQAVQAGAQDYLVRGKINPGLLLRSVRYAVERKTVEKRLYEMALHDQLTGLANRVLFRERLAHTLARARRDQVEFAVLFLDVDRFKSINDGLGHEAGDKFLRQIAARLLTMVREYDTVARFGGDEFAVLLDRIDGIQQAESIAERIMTTLRVPFQLDGNELVASASIGIAIFPQAGDTSDSLFQAADSAMYHAKSKGRANYEIYGSTLNDSASRRLLLEIELRRAVERGQLKVHYQPQFNMRSGEVVGAEALLRWTDDARKMVPPVEFVPILEDTGLILAVGEWVLNQACAQLKRWQSAGYALERVSVNVSPKQFLHGHLVEVVERAIAATGVAPEQLELEITEAVLLKNTDRTLSALRDLRAMGVKIAIDDFGTGYSSLAYLHQFPITTLKLDRSFMEDIGIDERRSAVAGAIIHLAKRLDLEVIAEGVEKVTQRDFLRDEGCHMVQGQLLGSACSPEDFEQFWQQTRVSRRPDLDRDRVSEIPIARIGKA